YLVTADGNNTATVLDTSNGTRLITYNMHASYVNATVWSPNGKEIASASADNTVQVWGAQSGKRRLVCRAADRVWTVAWSPNGAHIAGAGRDNITHVWDANIGQVTTSYQGPIGRSWGVTWSPDSECIATGYGDGTVQIHRTTDGRLLLTYHHQS